MGLKVAYGDIVSAKTEIPIVMGMTILILDQF